MKATMIGRRERTQRRWLMSMTIGLVFSAAAWAGPTVVPTAEGQIGDVPAAGDAVLGSRFESVRGQTGDLIFGGLTLFGGAVPPPPEFEFLTDRTHDTSVPVVVDTTTAQFNAIEKLPPASGWSRNATNDGDFVAFSFAVDGSQPQTLTVRVATFDETGASLVNVPAVQDVTTFPIPDPSAAETGIVVDNQGRVTVAYTELENGNNARIRAQRLDALTGLPIGGSFPITNGGQASVDIALLDPAGNRMIVPFSTFNTIRGAIVDTSGGVPVVLPDFPISTTPALFAHLNPVVGANTSTGATIVAWEEITGVAGNPGDIRGRRFDSAGNPIGDDFVVNATTANNQSQPDLAVDPITGASAIVWAGDAVTPGDELDSFLQVYDAFGNPIGGEIRVNTNTAGVQDRPAVNFLPEADDQGRPQVLVTWRDTENGDGTMANGTGNSYKCFSINGLADPTVIFADGFESGDTSAWTSTVP